MTVHDSNSITCEVEAGGSILGQPLLHDTHCEKSVIK